MILPVAMGPKPVVVAVRLSNPMVFAEFERRRTPSCSAWASRTRR